MLADVSWRLDILEGSGRTAAQARFANGLWILTTATQPILHV